MTAFFVRPRRHRYCLFSLLKLRSGKSAVDLRFTAHEFSRLITARVEVDMSGNNETSMHGDFTDSPLCEGRGRLDQGFVGFFPGSSFLLHAAHLH